MSHIYQREGDGTWYYDSKLLYDIRFTWWDLTWTCWSSPGSRGAAWRRWGRPGWRAAGSGTRHRSAPWTPCWASHLPRPEPTSWCRVYAVSYKEHMLIIFSDKTFYLNVENGVFIIAFFFQEAWSSMIISDPDPFGKVISDPDLTCQVITDPDPDM